MVIKAASKSEMAWFYLCGFDRLELRAIYLTVRRPPNLAAFYVAELIGALLISGNLFNNGQ